jgi:hypothetical protein
MFQKLHTPDCIICFSRPVGTSGEVMLYNLVLGIWQQCLFHCIMASLQTQNICSLLQKVQCRYAFATTNI